MRQVSRPGADKRFENLPNRWAHCEACGNLPSPAAQLGYDLIRAGASVQSKRRIAISPARGGY
jgi:hypothetical protein